MIFLNNFQRRGEKQERIRTKSGSMVNVQWMEKADELLKGLNVFMCHLIRQY